MCYMFIQEVATALFCWYMTAMNAIQPNTLLLSRQCVVWLILYIAHIITSNPLLLRLRFGRTLFTRPTHRDVVDFFEPIITYVYQIFASNPVTAFIAASPANFPLTALIAHVFGYSTFLAWRFRRSALVTRAIPRDEQVSTHCCICTEPIMIIDGEASDEFGGVIRLPCNHYYHGSCVWLWMDTRYRNALRPNCPMCRREMRFYWFDYDMPEESDMPDERDEDPRANSDVNPWMYTLLQLMVLTLLLIVSAKPLAFHWGSVVEDLTPIFHPLVAQYIYIRDDIMRGFSFMTGMELPATCVALVV
jgi:hypothetical protein